MRKSNLSIAAIIALVFSLLQPTGAALSVDTVTKSFTVTKSDGTPYTGVSVALVGWDEDLQQSIVSELATTNSSGQASVAVPTTSTSFYGYAAQPGTGDYSHAAFVEYNIVSGENQTIAIKLKPANLVVEMKQTSGASAVAGSWVYFPSDGDVGDGRSGRVVIRSGPIGLDVSSDLSPDEAYDLRTEPSGMSGQFGAEFGLRIAVVNNAYSLRVFQNTTSIVQLEPRVVSGVNIHDLSFGAANLTGQLSDANGIAVAMPSGAVGSIEVFRANSAGDFAAANSAAGAVALGASGAYASKIYITSAGKYFPLFRISGSHAVPSFVGQPFFINDAGQFSNSLEGPFLSAGQFQLVTRIPTADMVNLKLAITVPGSNTAEPSYVDLSQQTEDGSGSLYWGSGRTISGLSAYALPDGIYNLWVSPLDSQRTAKEFEITVDLGVATVVQRNAQAVTVGEDGIFRMSGGVTNLKLKVVSPTNPGETLPQASVDIFTVADGNESFVSNAWVQSGFAYLSLPAGVYKMVVNPQRSAFTQKDFTLTISSGGISIVDLETNETVSSVGGFFTVSASVPNITGKLVDVDGEPVVSSGSARVNLELQKWNFGGGNWDWIGGNTETMSDGSFGFRVTENGKYRVRAQVSGRVDLATTNFNEFIFDSNSENTQLGNLTMKTPLLVFKVVQSGKTVALRNAEIEITDRQDFYDFFQTGNSGAAALSFDAAGTYYLTVRPPYSLSSAVAANKTYTVTVISTSGVLAASISGKTATAGVFTLELGVPNVTGKVLTPEGGLLTRGNGAWANIQAQKYLIDETRWEWTNFRSQIAPDGTFGLSISELGTYRLRIEPKGVPGSATTITSVFAVTDANVAGVAKAFGELRLSAPSAKFRVRLPGSIENLKYAGIEIRKDGQWHDWINTDQTGVASFAALEAGTYEFIVHPNGNGALSGVRKTYAAVVTETSTSGIFSVVITGVTPDSAGTSTLILGQPNVSGRLIDKAGIAVGQTNKTWVNIQLQRFDNERGFWDWTNNSTNVRSDGTFGLSVEQPGRYRLRIEANGRQDLARTLSEEFTITSSNLSTFSKNFGSVVLNGPSLSGTVSAPTGTIKIANSQVVATDSETGQEMWEYATQTDSLGRWSMLLPEGNYSVYARSPWGKQELGSGDPFVGIQVDSNGIATKNSAAVGTISLRLAAPTWSGTVTEPGSSTAMPFVSVCLQHSEASKPSFSCSESNNLGQWSLTKPFGFTGFNENSALFIRENRNPQFAENRLSGATAIEAALGSYVAGATFVDKALSPLAPNTSLTIKAGTDAAPNVWVSIDRDGLGWLTGGMTNSFGVVKLNVTNPSLGFNVRTDLGNNQSLAQGFTSTQSAFSAQNIADGTAAGVFGATIQLAVPNFRARIMSPGLNGAPVANSWVDAYDEASYTGGGGSNSNTSGNVALKLATPVSGTSSYKVTVRPPWNNPDLLASKVYFVKVGTSGITEVHSGSLTGDLITASDGVYNLTLATPSVTGSVTLPDTSPIGNTYVNVTQTVSGYEQWLEGGATRPNGSFGLALPDGSYELQANSPWGLSGYAKSAKCAVTVAGGSVSSATSTNCVAGGKVTLALRVPNLKFKLVHNGAPVANAHVNISIGNWHTWAQAGQNGLVSLFIDSDEVQARNPGATGSQEVRVSVDPPGGNNDIVRWDCTSGQAKPICADLDNFVFGQPYLATARTLPDVSFATPNTKLNVKLPDGSNAGAGSWVSLFYEDSGWRRWIGSSNTNSSGEAVFNVDSNLQTGTFAIEVNANWSQRQEYSQKLYTGLTFANLDLKSFKLGSANLKLSVKQADTSTPSRWSWVEVREVDASTFADVSWLGGFGTDEFGRVALNLPDSKTVRVTLHPGPGSVGARTSCVFTVDSSSVVAKVANQCIGQLQAISSGSITLSLSAGNVVGRVTKAATADGLEGAIVFAQAYEAGTQTLIAGKTEQAVTKANGQYGLQLDQGYDWQIKVFYVKPEGETVDYVSLVEPRTLLTNSLGTQQEQDIALLVRVAP